MDWDFNTETGSGKVSVLTINSGDIKWVEDKDSDPIGQASSKGAWLKTMQGVPANQIISAESFGKAQIKELI